MPKSELTREPTGRADSDLTFEIAAASSADSDLDREPTGRVESTLEFHAAGEDA